jgi:hypothetical protein
MLSCPVCVANDSLVEETGLELIRSYGDGGVLISEHGESVPVRYWIDEYQDFGPDGKPTTSLQRRGRLSNIPGHCATQAIASLQRGPFTLVLSDGRKLNVWLQDLNGSVQIVSDFL